MTTTSASSKPSKAPYLKGWLLCRVTTGPHKFRIGCTKNKGETIVVRFSELNFIEIPREHVEILCGCWAAREALTALASVTD